MTDDERRETSTADLLADLRDELDATAELPVSPRVSPWLGEAAAVAADAADAAAAADAATEGVEEAFLRERVAHVRRLLAEVDETGNDAADERVAAARRLVERIESNDRA